MEVAKVLLPQPPLAFITIMLLMKSPYFLSSPAPVCRPLGAVTIGAGGCRIIWTPPFSPRRERPMSKLLKDTHVYIPRPACGKVEGVKLKWAQQHKSMKCGKCREKVDLRSNPAHSLIVRTG